VNQVREICANNVVNSDYIFFASYLQPPTPEGAGVWSNADDLETVNGTHHPPLIPVHN